MVNTRRPSARATRRTPTSSVSPEHRRRQDRDEQLLAGLHPWADGLTQLASRYRDELAHGAWTLPAHWPNPEPPPENTARL